MSLLKSAVIFAAGVATGVLATRYYYKKQADFETENLPGEDENENNSESEEVEPEPRPTSVYISKPPIDEAIARGRERMASIINDAKYYSDAKPPVNYTIHYTKKVPEPEGPTLNPFRVITEEEFIALTEGREDSNPYAEYSVAYYVNDILVDEDGIPFENPEYLIGDEAMDILSDHDNEEPYIYVADDQEQCAFEIMRCDTEYNNPALEED